jgi:hypothetical protein
LNYSRIYGRREEYVDFMVLRLPAAIKVRDEGTDAFLRWSNEIDTSEMRRRLAWYCNVVNDCRKGNGGGRDGN